MRRVLALLGACAFALACVSVPARAEAAPPRLPGAWILVDNDTGAILEAGNARAPMRPASVAKIITALTAVQLIKPDAQVPISVRTEQAPAMKMNLKAGETWSLSDLLHTLLMVSANDAAVALAEQASTTLDAFADELARTAQRLGMQDGPVLRDPAGLDDEFSVAGGNEISARDLAIATRALLATPVLRDIVAKRDYRFHGGDGNDHRLFNHNKLLSTYPGAIGVKTGYTAKASHTLVSAATRGGRTMVAVVLKADDAYRSSAALLDQGFATPVAAEPGLDRLPPVVNLTAPTGRSRTGDTSVAAAAPATRQITGVSTVARPRPQGDEAPPTQRTSSSTPSTGRNVVEATVAVLGLGLLPAFAIFAVSRRRRPPRRLHQRYPVSRPRRPEASPSPPRSTASSPEGLPPPARWDALVREHVGR